MKKKNILSAALLLSLAALTAGGCSSGKDETPQTQAQTEESHVITGYLVEDAEKYVTLGNLKGLSVAHPVYELTDGEVEYEIENIRYEYARMQQVDRASEFGDTLTLTVKAVAEGESEPVIDEEEYSYELGYEEFGQEFDAELTGKKAGDAASFTIAFTADNTYNEDWIGKTIDFDVTVTAVSESVVPEYTDDFVTTTLGYDSKEAFETALREELTARYAEQADQETLLNALNAAMDECKFDGWPDQLYDSVSEEVRSGYESFAAQFGMSNEELYENFGLTDEGIKEEVIYSVNQRLFVSAVCNREGLTLTDTEYEAYAANLAEQYQYQSVEDLTVDYGKSALVWEAYTNKAAGFIVLNADLYDAPVSAEDGMIEEDYEDFEDGEVIEYDDGSLEDDEMSFYDADEEDYAEGFIDEEEYWEETEF